MTVEVRSNGAWWIVKDNGTTVSRHRLKQRAVDAATRIAREKKDLLRIQRDNGTIQTQRRY